MATLYYIICSIDPPPMLSRFWKGGRGFHVVLSEDGIGHEQDNLPNRISSRFPANIRTTSEIVVILHKGLFGGQILWPYSAGLGSISVGLMELVVLFGNLTVLAVNLIMLFC
jgi:hypothetical protein